MEKTSAALTRLTLGNPSTKRHGLDSYPLFDPTGVLGSPFDDITTSTDRIVVSELSEPTVSALQVTNSDHRWVLLLSGTELRGGHQNRMITETSFVPPGTTTTVNTVCVERGRWGGTKGFGTATPLAPYDIRIVAPRRRKRTLGRVASRELIGGGLQTEVWMEVRRFLDRLGVQSPTDDLATSAEHRLRGGLVADVRQLICRGPLPKQIGVAVAVGERLLGIDLFCSPHLLAESWGNLISSYATCNRSNAPTTPAADATLRVLRVAGRADLMANPLDGDVMVQHIVHEEVVGSIASRRGTLVHAHLVPAT